jgi:S-DNA-T family DNA segregation ATPase FtsK/SpoIIIE
MESADDAEVDGGDVETVGGVEIKIERLSEEERERGEKIAEDEEPEYQPRPYTYPRVDLLNEPKPHNALKDQEIRAKMQKLNATLTNFKVRVDGISYVCGPAVTRYEVRPAPGVRVRSIANLADDIAMSLAAKSIRIEAPIPGKEAVGIEVPNTTRETVFLRRLIDSDEFRTRPSKLTACLGEDVAGNPILFDIVKMPHLLVAGTTGSGKSVCINDFIMSLVFKSTPQEVKIILIDPKQVEFTVYKDLPHLMAPIVCDPKRAAAVLNLAVLEMEKRFQMIRDVQARNIEGYNAATENDRYEHPYMPHIVIIIDELADLMMQAKEEVETSIVRLAQKARAAGMHLIIGTQRPSVDVITGLIKANVPSRIACTVVSQVDSRTILDVAGAEKLLGMGDMLYAPVGSPKPLRVQGAFVSDGEVERIVEFIKRNNDPVRYDQEFMDNIDREAAMIGTKRQPGSMDDEDDGESPDGMDPKFYEALRIALDNKRISTSLLQRMLSIGYGRAAKIIDQMERMGFVGPAVGNKPREIRITEQGYAELMMNKDQ